MDLVSDSFWLFVSLIALGNFVLVFACPHFSKNASQAFVLLSYCVLSSSQQILASFSSFSGLLVLHLIRLQLEVTIKFGA